MSHLLTEFALNVLGPRGVVDGGHGVQGLATEAHSVAHLLLVDALKEPVKKYHHSIAMTWCEISERVFAIRDGFCTHL